MKTGVITQKLNSLRQYVEELTSLSQRSLQEYLHDAVLRRAVERVLQITIECIVDCNNLIIVGLGERPASDHKSTLLTLADKGVLTEEFARRLVAYVKTRNLLVHEYEILVYAAMQTGIKDFLEYRRQIAEFLDKLKKKKSRVTRWASSLGGCVSKR